MPIEPFAFEDASALAELTASVGWRDAASDWRAVLAAGEVVGVCEAGAPIAVAARFDFGRVWRIGKVVVHPAHQGRGHARRILEELLCAERARDTHVTLVATRMGEPVYRRLGFRTIGTVHKLIGPVAGAPVNGVESLAEAHIEPVLALDRAVFGGDRGRLLRARIGAATRAVVCVCGGVVVGFGMSVSQSGIEVIGPIVAPDDEVALRIVRALVTRDVKARRIEVPSTHERLVERLMAMGFAKVDVPPVMSLGGSDDPGELARRFALASQAFG